MWDAKNSRFIRRSGFSYLELQVAFVLFAVALSGVGPMVVMQSRQLQRLDRRFSDNSTYYLIPSDNEWAGKLGAGAAVSTETPALPPDPPVMLIDNGAANYSEVNVGWWDWYNLAFPSAYGGLARGNFADNAGDKAVWTFSQLRPGWYEIYVTYPPWSFNVSNASFLVYDGDSLLDTVQINQQTPPSGPVFDSVPWDSLGTRLITSDRIKVELLEGSAWYFVVADAVRIVPITNDLVVQSVQKSLSAETVTATVSVQVNTP